MTVASGTGTATTTLSFSTPHIRAEAVVDATEVHVPGRTIVVNLGTSPVAVAGDLTTCVPPFSSTVLRDATLLDARMLLLLTVLGERNIGALLADPSWELYGELLTRQIGRAAFEAGGFPPDTPLFRSPQDTVGRITFDPSTVLEPSGEVLEPSGEVLEPSGEVLEPSGASAGPRDFEVRANLWFAPGGTDCAIHNQHDFIEIHTQVHGTGRMQKFRECDPDTLYQDILMSPGYTTSQPFCRLDGDGRFSYPWHQYYSDTDCVWLAVEYHPV